MNYKDSCNKGQQSNKQIRRLQFPINGDSGYFQNVGKKHYDIFNNQLDKWLLNPQANNYRIRSNHSQTVQKNKRSQNKQIMIIPYSPNISNKYKNLQQDSLLKIQREYENKRLAKSNKIFQPISNLRQESNQKNQDTRVKSNNIFAPIQYYYDLVQKNKKHGLQVSQSLTQMSRKLNHSQVVNSSLRIISPTYISSRFQAA